MTEANSIVASIYEKYLVGPSISTRCCFKMTNIIQVCGDFHGAWVSIINTRPVEITGHGFSAASRTRVRTCECKSGGVEQAAILTVD